MRRYGIDLEMAIRLIKMISRRFFDELKETKIFTYAKIPDRMWRLNDHV